LHLVGFLSHFTVMVTFVPDCAPRDEQIWGWSFSSTNYNFGTTGRRELSFSHRPPYYSKNLRNPHLKNRNRPSPHPSHYTNGATEIQAMQPTLTVITMYRVLIVIRTAGDDNPSLNVAQSIALRHTTANVQYRYSSCHTAIRPATLVIL